MLYGRQIRSRLDYLLPDVATHVKSKQTPDQVKSSFSDGSTVWVRNYSGPDKWKAGVVLRQLGPVTFEVQVGTQLYHRHVGQLRPRHSLDTDKSDEERQENLERVWDAELEGYRRRNERPAVTTTPHATLPPVVEQPQVVAPSTAETTDDDITVATRAQPNQQADLPLAAPVPSAEPPAPLRRSTRERKPATRKDDFVYYGTGVKKK